MNLLEALTHKENVIKNTKGSKYYQSTFNDNLDFFCAISRFNNQDKIEETFKKAINENESLALANLLHVLDIRGGKGERRIFKICFKYLCKNHQDLAINVLPFIPLLGRYDYILEGIYTPIEDKVIELIATQLKEDINSNTPSLLAKWLPSLRTHNQNSCIAKYIVKKLNITEKEYRHTLSSLRLKINIVEKNLTTKNYHNIDFNTVPAKAMLKYENLFSKVITKRYEQYLASLSKGESKVNTNGLFSYVIIKKIWEKKQDDILLDTMWNNQKDVLNGINTNVLVVADTSGSMNCYNSIPLASSIGLAIYTAERNTGIFKDTFITFSSRPKLEKVKGKTIFEKVNNVKYIVSNTDIDKVFELILDLSIKNNLKQEDLPSHILLISDMEFDEGVFSKNGTNFDGWKKAFNKQNFKLPTIIFWNVADYTNGVPITKNDNDVIMINGFSTNLLENIFNLDNYNPTKYMISCLDKYLQLLKNN